MKTRIAFPVWVLLVIGTVSLASAQSAQIDYKPGSGGAQSCPQSFLFQFGSTYYYSTVFCGANCEDIACDSIKGYPSLVATGCVGPAPCQCNCKSDPTTVYDRVAVDGEVVQAAANPKKEIANALPEFPRNKSALAIGTGSQLIAKVPGAAGDDYFYCFRISFNQTTPAGTVRKTKYLAIPLDGAPNLKILNEGIDAGQELRIQDGQRKTEGGKPCISAGTDTYFTPQ